MNPILQKKKVKYSVTYKWESWYSCLDYWISHLSLSIFLFITCFFFHFYNLDLQEKNVNLKLTIVDTVGYGDQINKEDRYADFK